MSLQEYIKGLYDNDSLIELHRYAPSLRIDLEIARRLDNCDVSVLKYTHAFMESDEVRRSIKKYIRCIPWRIGVIYNYKSGRIYGIEVSVGFKGKYTINGKNILVNWLDSSKNELMLREVTSSNFEKLYNLRYVYDQENSEYIADYLLRNDNVSVGVLRVIGPNIIRSFPNPLPSGESFEYIPTMLNDKIPLFQDALYNETYNIPVKYSDDILLFKKLYLSAF